MSSHDGAIEFHLSQIPLKYDRFPLNIRLNLQFKSPLVLDITSSEKGVSLVAEDEPSLQEYFIKGYEVHQVIFEGHLGSYENKTSHIIHLKQ